MKKQWIQILKVGIDRGGKFTITNINKAEDVYINSPSKRVSEMMQEGLVEVFEEVKRTKEHPNYNIYQITPKGLLFLKKPW